MIDGDISSGLSKTGALSRSNPLDVSGELVSGDKAFAKFLRYASLRRHRVGGPAHARPSLRHGAEAGAFFE